MAPPRWTTTAQLMLLTEWLPEFLEAQKSHTTTKFFQRIYQKFFALHPEAVPLVAINPHPENTPEAIAHDRAQEAESAKALQKLIVMKQAVSLAHARLDGPKLRICHQRIKNWFNNHHSKAPARSKTIPFLMQLKPRRRLHAVELYSQLWYNSRVRPLIRAEIESRQLTRSQMLLVVKVRTREAFDAESDELKQEIYDQLADQVAADTDDRENSAKTPEQIAQYIFHAMY